MKKLYQKYFKIFFPALIILFTSFSLYAQQKQLSKEEINRLENLRDLYKKRGMTDDQINQLLKNSGYILGDTKDASKKLSYSDSLRMQIDQRKRFQIEGVPDLGAEEKVMPVELTPFGFDVFKIGMVSFEPVSFGPVTPDYILGPGDEIVIDTWGQVESIHKLKIDRLGGINIPEKVGRINLTGLTYAKAENLIRTRMKKVHSSIEDGKTTVSVSMGELRNIAVYLLGEVSNPGIYNTSPFVDIIQSFYYANGPTLKASLRNIEVHRGSRRIYVFDLYDFILHGKSPVDIRLQNQDRIVVPLAGKQVYIQGEVNRPRIYELKDNETFRDLLEFAGDYTPRAFIQRILVKRIVPPELRKAGERDVIVLDFDGSGKSEEFKLEDGDKITVNRINDIYDNYVTLTGQVKQPGIYQYVPGMKVSDLLSKGGGILESAYLDYGHLISTHPDSTRSFKSFNLSNILNSGEGSDVLLASGDEVEIFSLDMLNPKKFVRIDGEVRFPGDYYYMENLSVIDLILRAGGLKKDALKDRVELARIIETDGKNDTITQSIELKIGKSGKIIKKTFLLQPKDNVFVRKNPGIKNQKIVSIAGEVNYPGKYSINVEGERLFSLIERSGGLKKTAYLEGAIFIRKENNTGIVALNFAEICRNQNHTDNLTLFDGDSLYIPSEHRTVKILGEVGLPASVLFEKGKGVGYYVERAGGYTSYSDKWKVKIIFPNGRISKPKRFWFDPEILSGTTIIVPRKPEGVGIDWGSTIRDVSAIVTAFATTYFILNDISSK